MGGNLIDGIMTQGLPVEKLNNLLVAKGKVWRARETQIWLEKGIASYDSSSEQVNGLDELMAQLMAFTENDLHSNDDLVDVFCYSVLNIFKAKVNRGVRQVTDPNLLGAIGL